jgi:hypothetical protein
MIRWFCRFRESEATGPRFASLSRCCPLRLLGSKHNMVFFHRTHLLGFVVVVALLFSPATCRDAPPSSPPQTSFPVERFVVNLDLPPQQRCTSSTFCKQNHDPQMANLVFGLWGTRAARDASVPRTDPPYVQLCLRPHPLLNPRRGEPLDSSSPNREPVN